MHVLSLPALALIGVVAFASCGEPDATDVLLDEVRSSLVDGEYPYALEVARAVLERELSTDERYAAMRYAFRCEAVLEKGAARSRLRDMRAQWPERFTVTELVGLGTDLSQDDAYELGTEVVALGRELYPDAKQEFDVVGQLLADGNTDPGLKDRLGDLGYLSGDDSVASDKSSDQDDKSSKIRK